MTCRHLSNAVRISQAVPLPLPRPPPEQRTPLRRQHALTPRSASTATEPYCFEPYCFEPYCFESFVARRTGSITFVSALPSRTTSFPLSIATFIDIGGGSIER